MCIILMPIHAHTCIDTMYTVNVLTDSSFDVSLRIDPTAISVINTTDYGSDGLVFHSYNLSQPYKTVMVSVYPASANQTLNVYVQFEESPTLDEFDYHIVVRCITYLQHQLTSLNPDILLQYSVKALRRW